VTFSPGPQEHVSRGNGFLQELRRALPVLPKIRPNPAVIELIVRR